VKTSDNYCLTRKNIVLLLLVTVFLFKGIFYALYLNIPSVYTSPDDVGHISYVQYIYATKSLPIYGVHLENTTAKSYKDNMANKSNEGFDYLSYSVGKEGFADSNGQNWIIQHPPLYYILMTPVYAVTKYFTDKLAYLIIMMRLATLILGMLSVFVIGKILDCIGTGQTAYYCILIAYVFYAPIQFVFTTVTNDSLLILLCLVALLFLLRFIYLKKQRYFYLFAVSCGLIFMTKYTGVLVIAAYLLFLLYYVLKNYNVRYTLKLFLYGIITAVIIDVPYLIRNIYCCGKLFPMGGDPKTYDYSFAHFLRSGYFDEIIKNFTALIGWKVFVQAKDLNVYCFAALLAFAVLVYFINLKSKKKLPIIAGITALCIITALGTKFILKARYSTGVILAAALAITIIAVYEWVKNRDDKKATVNLFFVFTILLVVGFFVYKHFVIFNSRGHFGAMHGRYYYIAILPMLYVLFNKFDGLNKRFTQYLPNLLLIFMAANELIVLKDCFINF
jgi:4-amino-4-deoxy-L-arabinose transferase-like glycosyltransferase